MNNLTLTTIAANGTVNKSLSKIGGAITIVARNVGLADSVYFNNLSVRKVLL